jgi:hypothetical protein
MSSAFIILNSASDDFYAGGVISQGLQVAKIIP